VPGWTQKNFNDIRDVSPEHVQIQWRFAREVLRSPELGVSRFTYKPGARMPWGHRHREQEAAYVVVGGGRGYPMLGFSHRCRRRDDSRIGPSQANRPRQLRHHPE
jgi:hypothetical protein